MRKTGQILILFAILLPVLLILLALAVDAGRLYIERDRMKRAAQSAADAGISVVAEQMVTQVVLHQTETAMSLSGFTVATETPAPKPKTIAAWISNEDRSTLVAPPIQTASAQEALEYARLNGFNRINPDIHCIEITYPQIGYLPEDTSQQDLRFEVSICRQTTVLMAGLLGEQFVDLRVHSISVISQR